MELVSWVRLLRLCFGTQICERCVLVHFEFSLSRKICLVGCFACYDLAISQRIQCCSAAFFTLILDLQFTCWQLIYQVGYLQSVVKDFLRLPSMRTPAVKKSRSLRSILRHENPELAVERSMPAGMSHKMLVSKSFVKTRKSSNSPKLVVRRVRFSDDAARKVSRGQGAGWRAWALAEAILPKVLTHTKL